MELRSVAYNQTQALGMQGMSGMQGMQGMQDMSGMPGMQGMQGMQGMPMGPEMYPPSGFANLDVASNPGFGCYDDGCCPMPCSPCDTPEMYHHQPCPMPTPTPVNKVYVVKKGDTVYKIAKRFGTTMQAIISANNLRNPSLIYPGQILFIPTLSTEECYG
jgi:nucleoid-associated protein YgaU